MRMRSLSLFFFKVCKYSKLSFRNLAFPLHGSFAISTVSFPVLIFSILPKIYIEIAVLVGFQKNNWCLYAKMERKGLNIL